ncbi:protein tramtrack, beta isoform-like [Diabrotica virgifera virgifera]|uniref:Protein tramtrack, beta isoform-like n=1 Tax=Diabrotica virgifera virgifera TaxID=50390 RepID=A0A6P7GK75_DIAVI|nr:protein tramtrack, beta isoform-like [Diabrotica virgifera virgifera]
MSDQQFVLRWHYHENTLVHNLPCFLDGDIMTDVTLSVGSHQVKAHKIILAMCSVYFLQLFQEMKSAHPVVILHNVSFEEVKAILSFMYRGQCVVSQDQLPSLLSVAKLLKVQGLCDMKVPENRPRPEGLSKNEPLQSSDKLINDDNFHRYEYDCKLRPADRLTENILSKRHYDDDTPKNEYSNIHHNFKSLNYYDDNVLPLTKDSTEPIPLKYEEPYLFPRKCPSKDSSETCKCFLCGKYLSNQYNLRVHMETHEEAYHACQSCPHVSRSRDALRKHVSYRHPEEYHNRKRRKTDT